ncbi:MAG: peptide chain release factor N(5)-glutamine methyltransferase [Planctomycetes bacterium]|nr:peptide chain release factor N(5)-glutamine methyltransferase [Planctomycetota bacterium]
MARAFLERKELGEARLEAELLVAHALGLSRLQLYLDLERPVSPAEVDVARDALVRRGRREPTAYITGKREFYGRDFAVAAGVLVPRPETEQLVDLARDASAARGGADGLRVADLGCGSGCLAVTLALELAGSVVTAVDVSPSAVEQTRRNAERLGAAVEVLLGDGLDVLAARGPFDLLVSNPPYVMPEEAPELAPEVREYEPELALYAPAGDPDHWVRRVVERFDALVAPGGLALVELGWKQRERVLALAAARGLAARVHDDLERVPRVLELRRA